MAGESGETSCMVQDTQQSPKLWAGVGPPKANHSSPCTPTSCGTESPNALPPRQATGLGSEWIEPTHRRLWLSAECIPKDPATSLITLSPIFQVLVLPWCALPRLLRCVPRRQLDESWSSLGPAATLGLLPWGINHEEQARVGRRRWHPEEPLGAEEGP